MDFFSHYVVRYGVFLWCFLCFPLIAFAEENLCESPPVTSLLLLEMEAYNATIKKTLDEKSCLPLAYKLFGLEFTGIGDQESQVSKKFWGTLAPQDLEKKEKEINGFSNTISAQLLQDVDAMKKQLDSMRPYVNTSFGVCATPIRVNESLDGKSLGGMSLSESLKARYVAYRQLYFWLLNARSTERSELKRDLASGEEQLTTLILEKYTRASGTNNPFYLPPYQYSTFTQCQAEEFGVGKVNEAIDRFFQVLKEARDSSVKFTEEVGSLANPSELTAFFDQMKKSVDAYYATLDTNTTPEQRSEAAFFVNQTLRTMLTIPGDAYFELSEVLTKVSKNIRFNGKPVTDYSIQDLQRDTVQVDDITGKITRRSLSDYPEIYSRETANVDAEKEKGLEEYLSTSYDTLGAYTTSQYMLGKLDGVNKSLSKLTKKMNTSAEDFAKVCKIHLYRDTDDCGDVKK